MDIDAISALVVVVGVPLGLIGYVALSEGLIRPFGRATRNKMRPWMWLLPGLALMGLILYYPLLSTLWSSFFSTDGKEFLGLANYVWAFTSPDVLSTIGNSLLWILILPIVVLLFGLLFAVLSDRVKYEKLAKGLIMVPSAISLVVGGVIWSLAYRVSEPGQPQVGIVNALWTLIPGNQPVAWTIAPGINNLALMFIGLWTWLGFATILISAGLKGVPTEYLEAARLDGGNEWQIFRSIVLPALMPTLIVVFTTLVVWTLKVFDIIYIMTGGQYGTDVLAQRVYTQFFVQQQYGEGSALAIILFLMAIPVMIINGIRVRRETRA